MILRFLIAVVACLIFGAGTADALQLQFPLACEIGKDCFIQQYVDHDASSGVADYRCGVETYDGHDGTDFRVSDVKADVEVRAAAPGIVKAARDGMDDRLATTPDLLAAVSKVECGNGLVIAHEEGYETQYCHMRKGSLIVHVGDKVDAGAPLGRVGYSGAAAFPHLHLSVRQNGSKIDPFSGPMALDCHQPPQGMWDQKSAAQLSYQGPTVITTGWSSGAVTSDGIELRAYTDQPRADWPALVAFARIINVRQGDEINLTVSGPAGELAHNDVALNHDKAQDMLFAGLRPHQALSAGRYEAKLVISRDSTAIVSKIFVVEIAAK
jgi:hypothetical protein